MKKVKIKKLYEDSIIPTRSNKEDAGWDLYAHEDATIGPHLTIKIGTGIAIATPKRMFAGVFARSGLASKQGLRPANCVGVVDTGYRGEVIVALHNDGVTPVTINKGDRIAQLIFIPFKKINFKEVEELSDTDRGTGGLGSTGK